MKNTEKHEKRGKARKTRKIIKNTEKHKKSRKNKKIKRENKKTRKETQTKEKIARARSRPAVQAIVDELGGEIFKVRVLDKS